MWLSFHVVMTIPTSIKQQIIHKTLSYARFPRTDGLSVKTGTLQVIISLGSGLVYVQVIIIFI